jgi:hypothetical protein
MSAQSDARRSLDRQVVRESQAFSPAVRAARRQTMAERLELAISWNSVAAELRAGLAAVRATDVRKP